MGASFSVVFPKTIHATCNAAVPHTSHIAYRIGTLLVVTEDTESLIGGFISRPGVFPIRRCHLTSSHQIQSFP